MFLNILQVYFTVTKLQNGEGITWKAGSGRLPHLSHIGKNHIKPFIAQNKYSSSDRIAADLATQQPGGEVVAARTVRHYLSKELDYKYGRHQRNFLLNDATKNAHLTWAVLHEGHNLNTTVFCDEDCFALGPDGRLMTWHPRHDKPIMEISQNPAKLHVLGAVSIFGTVGFLVFAPTWNSHTFSTQFAAEILPSATAFFGGNWHLQLDNATTHRSPAAELSMPFCRMACLKSSSSLRACLTIKKPIKNIGALMKQRVVACGAQDVHQLRAAIVAEWAALTLEEVEPFCSSIISRIQDMITVQGSHTPSIDLFMRILIISEQL